MSSTKIKKHQEALKNELKEIESKLSTMKRFSPNCGDLECRADYIRTELLPNDKKWFTQFLWSDAHCYEIVEQRTPDLYCVRQMDATITPEADKALKESFIPGGFCGHFDNSLQEWTFKSNEKNPVIAIRRHKNGKFYASNTRTCPFVMLNHQYEHYDYNF